MTSLIDVIFLLLLFFMLSSTFSRFAEVDLSAASAGDTDSRDIKKSFLQLGEQTLRVNGQDVALGALRTGLPTWSPRQTPCK